MRRKVKKKQKIQPDPKYESFNVSKFINYVMKDGKKSVASRVVYQALEEIQKKAKTDDPLVVLESAIKNASPSLEVRSRRIGGANYQVPREVRIERRLTLAVRWIVAAAQSQKGKPMYQRLAQELISASKSEGGAVKKKENTHKMAEANRAFAHFSW